MLRLNAGTCPEAAYGTIEKCVKIRQKKLYLSRNYCKVYVDHCIVDHAYVLIEKCGFLLPTSRDLNVIIGWIIWSIQMLTIKMVEKAKCCNV